MAVCSLLHEMFNPRTLFCFVLFCFVFKKKDKNSQRYSLNTQDKTKTVFLSASFFPFPIEHHQKVAHLKVSLIYCIPVCLASVHHLTHLFYPHGYNTGFLAAMINPAHWIQFIRPGMDAYSKKSSALL